MATSSHRSDPRIVDQLNADLEGELIGDLGSLSVSSRDWTVETIASQISAGNIDLNPNFQRRNAWTDIKRSRLIESLIWGIPVPQIVLAQSKERARSYIVIDGKQRLLTIAGYLNPNIKYWKKSCLTGLTHFEEELDGVDAASLEEDPQLADFYRSLLNADIRCTVISNYRSDDVLYEIFLRMNNGATRLSTQELRQVLCRGWFADWLIQTTSDHLPIHEVLGIDDSDERLVDVEILLRCISMQLFGDRYAGNMKSFLDESMRKINSDFSERRIEGVLTKVNKGVERLISAVGGPGNVGRRVVNGEFSGPFNRALFEVQQFYFSQIPSVSFRAHREEFSEAFIEWFNENPSFISSIESTTKSMERTRYRYREFGKFIEECFETDVESPL